MKVFHTENGKEAVYVQMQDIMYLSNETDTPIPATIFTKVFTGVTIVNDSNRFEFVRFDEEHEVKFFRDLVSILISTKLYLMNNLKTRHKNSVLKQMKLLKNGMA